MLDCDSRAGRFRRSLPAVCGTVLLALGALLGSLMSPVTAMAAAGAEWSADFEGAKARAAKDGKDLLLDFTGSDWCVWCKRLNEEVFSQATFVETAPKDFVLVKLDFPRNEALITSATRERNKRLANEFAVEGYPTIILTDAQGRPYAKTGYQAGGAGKYLSHLAELRQKRTARDEALARAAEASGLEQARLLDKALEVVGAELALSVYRDQVDRIIALDAQDTAGLNTKYRWARGLTAVDAAKRAHDTGAALAQIEVMLKDFSPSGAKAQELYYLRSELVYSKGDKAGAQADLERALEVAPDTPRARQIRTVLQNVFRKRVVDSEVGGVRPASAKGVAPDDQPSEPEL